LIDWDGEQFFDEILGLIKVCQITEFKEIYDTILSQVEQHFHVYTLIDKVIFIKQGRGIFSCSSIIKSLKQCPGFISFGHGPRSWIHPENESGSRS